MSMPAGKPGSDPDRIVLDKPLFDPGAFRLNDEQAAIVTSARHLGQSIFAGRAAPGGGGRSATDTPPRGGGGTDKEKMFCPWLPAPAISWGGPCPKTAGGKSPPRRNTLYLAIPAKSDGVSVVGDWDPLGMRG